MVDQKSILERVTSGEGDYTWGEIVSTHGEHEARFYVFEDALKLEGVRINVSARTQQLIADHLDAMLLTPKVADLLFAAHDVLIGPKPITPRGGLIPNDDAGMRNHSAQIDKELAGRTGIIQSVGKHWVLSNKIAGRPGIAANYGWHFEGATYQGIRGEVSVTGTSRVLQGVGTRHDMHHLDYSQTCVLMHQTCMLNDMEVSVSEVLSNPALAPLASHEGVLRVLRQPGV